MSSLYFLLNFHILIVKNKLIEKAIKRWRNKEDRGEYYKKEGIGF